jgi:peptidyl-dipeptidase Dcp
MMKTKTYFQLEKCWWFLLYSKLWLNFYWSFDIDKYHEEVTTYEVKDEKWISCYFTLTFSKKRKT